MRLVGRIWPIDALAGLGADRGLRAVQFPVSVVGLWTVAATRVVRRVRVGCHLPSIALVGTARAFRRSGPIDAVASMCGGRDIVVAALVLTVVGLWTFVAVCVVRLRWTPLSRQESGQLKHDPSPG